MAKLPYKKIQEAVSFIKATREEAITLANDIPNDVEVHALYIQKGFIVSPEPVGYMVVPLAKEWVGLTDEEMDQCSYADGFMIAREVAMRSVQAKLKEKNCG